MQELISHSHSIAEFFTADDWEYHQTSRRYFRNLINIGTSTVFRSVLCSHTAVLRPDMHLCYLQRHAQLVSVVRGAFYGVQTSGVRLLHRRILAPCLMVASFAALVALYNCCAPLLHYPLPGLPTLAHAADAQHVSPARHVMLA